jgi:tyrosine-protein phosphatase SIW14
MKLSVLCIAFVALRFPAVASAQIDITRFAQVSPRIYRGSRPDEATLKALAQMNVLTILDLEDDDEVVAAETVLAASYGIKVISTPMSGFWYPRKSQVNHSLQILTDASNGPIFVHCQHGEDRTGLIVGLYRVFYEHWSPSDAWNEMEANGFHRILFLLKEYYEHATGFEI